MNLILRTVGAMLLLSTGLGGGLGLCHHKAQVWWRLHTFSRLFAYWQGVLTYQTLTGVELIQRASVYPAFRKLGVDQCVTLAELPPPEELSAPLREEIAQGLGRIAGEPRMTACDTLRQLSQICEDAAVQKYKEAENARRLYPRLGLCAGVLAVILLW